MLDFVQQLVSGVALGCVYGLIALGFVLVYKATEVVNFAQGDLMMLGGFFAFTFIGMMGLNYWIGFAGAVAAMALFGMLAERVVVRPILGYPQFSIIMATIGLGYFLRSVAGMIWGTDDLKIETPFSQGVLRMGSLVLAYDKLSVIAATMILCALLWLFFNKTMLGTAMRASSAIAPIIRPVKIGDKLCVDGGVRANLPASAARDTGADVVVAVLVDDPLRKVPEKELRHFRSVAERMTNIVLAVTDEQQLQFADIVISPDVSGISIFSKKREDIERAMKAGEIAAEKAMPLIRQKLNLPPSTQLSGSSLSH